MPEIRTITLSHKEVVEALIRYQDIHEGIWQLYVEFGIAATNVATGEDQILPSAIVPVQKIGLHRVEKESPIAVDASKVNPK
jgi:hypothetical protein